MGPLGPFTVRQSWYDDYWFRPDAKSAAPTRLALRAGQFAALVALLISGLRGLGHH